MFWYKQLWFIKRWWHIIIPSKCQFKFNGIIFTKLRFNSISIIFTLKGRREHNALIMNASRYSMEVDTAMAGSSEVLSPVQGLIQYLF